MEDEEAEKLAAYGLADLGDALVETRQLAPFPPYWPDATFGFGARPNIG